jgi:calcineurin-like phosphoesterase family protein
MDAEMVVNWNIAVEPRDVVVHLGDFGEPKYSNEIGTDQLLTQDLNGRTIYVIPGNYDTPDVLDTLKQDPRVVVVTESDVTLNFVLMHAEVRPHNITTQTIRLAHAPQDAKDPLAFYLYGHIHQLQMVKRNGLNVGVDCHQFKPIDLEVVKFYYDAIMKHYDNNVFMSYLGGQV